ncbi:MAG: DUF1559 domain-containing protein [Victivallales bacterium]
MKSVRVKRKLFTIVELLVVIAIIGILASMILVALSVAKEQAKSITCKNNLKQVGLGMNLYINDYNGTYPTARWGTAPKVRWQNSIGTYIGGSVLDPSQESDATGTNVITNNILKCPSTEKSKYQLDPTSGPLLGKKREDYLRTGSYGYNWATFGTFHLDSAVIRKYPVNVKQIPHPSSTILVADSFGVKDKSETRPHSYTIDGPVQLNGRWGTALGQTPTDPRHRKLFNSTHGDGHVEEYTMVSAGYDANDPENVSGGGNPLLWNGYADSSITVLTP